MEYTPEQKLVLNVYSQSNLPECAKMKAHCTISEDMFRTKEEFEEIDNIRKNIVDTLWEDDLVSKPLLLFCDNLKLNYKAVFACINKYITDTRKCAPTRNTPRVQMYSWNLMESRIDIDSDYRYALLNCELLVLHVSSDSETLMHVISTRASNGRATILFNISASDSLQGVIGLVSRIGTAKVFTATENEF